MNTPTPKSQCQNCLYFAAATAETSGTCYGNPPTPQPGGFCNRPIVGRHDPACRHFKAAPPADAPLEVHTEAGRQEVRRVVESQIAQGAATPGTAVGPKWAPKGKRSQSQEARV